MNLCNIRSVFIHNWRCLIIGNRLRMFILCLYFFLSISNNACFVQEHALAQAELLKCQEELERKAAELDRREREMQTLNQPGGYAWKKYFFKSQKFHFFLETVLVLQWHCETVQRGGFIISSGKENLSPLGQCIQWIKTGLACANFHSKSFKCGLCYSLLSGIFILG